MIRIRVEEERDFGDIDGVIESAFGKKEECLLVEKIRASENYIEALSVVAVEVTSRQKEKVVGHLLMSKVHLESDDTRYEALSLAPVAVCKDYQGRGIGIQMIEFALQEARRFGHKVVTVLGHPDYYPKVGFEISDVYQILPPFEVRRQFFMVSMLENEMTLRPRGKVVYPEYFFE